jgi:hypothetical protein
MPEDQTRFRPDQVPNMAAVLQAPMAPMDSITRHHYENLASGNEVRKNGTVHTVYTIQVEIDGKPTLIPTVWDGEIITDHEEARDRAIDSGIKWPQRETHEELRKFDQKIHKKMKDISAKEAQYILDQKR